MEFAEKVRTGLRWSAAARPAGVGLSWIMTIIVLRLLSPSDYGVLAMAVILPSAFFLLNDLGLDVVLVQHRGPGELLRHQVFGVVITINLLSAVILVLGAPMIANFSPNQSLCQSYACCPCSSSCSFSIRCLARGSGSVWTFAVNR